MSVLFIFQNDPLFVVCVHVCVRVFKSILSVCINYRFSTFTAQSHSYTHSITHAFTNVMPALMKVLTAE